MPANKRVLFLKNITENKKWHEFSDNFLLKIKPFCGMMAYQLKVRRTIYATKQATTEDTIC